MASNLPCIFFYFKKEVRIQFLHSPHVVWGRYLCLRVNLRIFKRTRSIGVKISESPNFRKRIGLIVLSNTCISIRKSIARLRGFESLIKLYIVLKYIPRYLCTVSKGSLLKVKLYLGTLPFENTGILDLLTPCITLFLINL